MQPAGSERGARSHPPMTTYEPQDTTAPPGPPPPRRRRMGVADPAPTCFHLHAHMHIHIRTVSTRYARTHPRSGLAASPFPFTCAAATRPTWTSEPRRLKVTLPAVLMKSDAFMSTPTKLTVAEPTKPAAPPAVVTGSSRTSVSVSFGKGLTLVWSCRRERERERGGGGSERGACPHT